MWCSHCDVNAKRAVRTTPLMHRSDAPDAQLSPESCPGLSWVCVHCSWVVNGKGCEADLRCCVPVCWWQQRQRVAGWLSGLEAGCWGHAALSDPASVGSGRA